MVWWIVERSSLGYEIRLIGDNPRAARYAGIPIARIILLVFAVSGGLAGMAGMAEVTGVVHRLQDNFSPGYGYTAIIVAYLAKFHPLRVVPIAILFGALILAGREIQPSGVPAMIQGIILFCLISSEVFLRYRVRIVRRVPVGARRGGRGGLGVDLQLIVAAGIAVGTILLFAAVGEILAERSGVLNLGVEGMMLIGAVVGFGDRRGDRQPVAGRRDLDGRRRAAEPPARDHHDHVPRRPGRVRPGAHVPRHGPGAGARRGAQQRRVDLAPAPVLDPRAVRTSRSSARSPSPTRASSSYVGYLLVPAVWYWIHRTRPGLHLRAVGEEPAAADALGVNVYATRYRYVIRWAGCWPASPGRRSRWRSSPAGSGR